MLDITFYRDARDGFAGIAASGHADFDDCGQDIVCAAVSGVLQAARLGLERYASGRLDASQRPGKLRLFLREAGAAPSIEAIVTAADLAVTEIARRYPKHVRVSHAQIAPRAGGSARRRVTSLIHQRRPHDV